MDQPVRFGDIVSISDPAIGGFLCGDFSNSGSVFLDKQKRFNSTRSPHDLSECRFIVVQKLQYAAVKAYEKRIRLSGVAGLNHSNWKKTLDMTDPLYKDLVQDLKRMQDESETNKMEFKRKGGQPVTYGSIIQLKHFSARQYLTQTKNRAEVDRLSMELQLKAAGSEGSWWRVLPSGKVRKEGEMVHYGESIQLENAKFFSSLINVSTGEAICSCAPPDVGDFEGTPNVFMQLHSSGRCRFEVNASAMGSQFVLHRLCGSSYILRIIQGDEEGRLHKPHLRGLDVVTLCHRNSDMLLAASAAGGRLCWVQRTAEGLDVALTAWEVVPHKLDDACEEKPSVGEGLLLKHVASGLYLTRGRHGEVSLARDAFFQPKQHHTTPAGSIEEPPPGLVRSKSGGLSAMFGRKGGGPGGEGREPAWDEEGEQHLRGLWTMGACRGGDQQRVSDGSERIDAGGGGAKKLAGVVDGAVVWVKAVEGEEEAGSAVKWLGTGPRIKAGPGDASDPTGEEPLPLVRSVQSEVGPGVTLSRQGSQTRVVGSGAMSRFSASVLCGKAMSMHDAVEVRVVDGAVAADALFLRRSRQVLAALRSLLAELDPVQAEVDSDLAIEQAKEHPALHVLSASSNTILGCLRELVRRCTVSSNPDPLTRSGAPNQAFQNCLAEFGILDVVVATLREMFDVLRLPLRGVRSNLPCAYAVARMLYKLVEMASHRNARTKQAMVQHTTMFYNHKHGVVGSYYALLAVVSGSRKAMDHLGTTRLDEAHSMLKTYRSVKLLRLLRATCQCGEVPIVENQNMWARTLLSMPETVLETEADGRDVLLKDSRDGSRYSVREVLKVGEQNLFLEDDSAETPGQQVLHYYVSMLELFGSMALGRNEMVTAELQSNAARFGVEEGVLRRIFGDGHMPFRLREACCNLYSRLFVDRHPYRAIPTIAPARVWSMLRGVKDDYHMFRVVTELEVEDGEGCGVGEATCGYGRTLPSERRDELKELLVKLAVEAHETDCDELPRNRFTLALVQLVENLFRFGFYHYRDPQTNRQCVNYPEMRIITLPLFKVLDGRADQCRPLVGMTADQSRFELTEGAQVVMDIKLKVLQLFNDFFHVSQNDGVSRLVSFWEDLLRRRFQCSSWDWCVNDLKVNIDLDAYHGVPKVTSTGDRGKEGLSPAAKSVGSHRNPSETWHRHEREGSVQGSSSSPQSPKRFLPVTVQDSTVADAAAGHGKGALHKGKVAAAQEKDFSEYAEHPTLWEEEPPWTEKELQELSGIIFGSELSILDEFSVNSIAAMFGRGNSVFVPDWVKILLDLVRYKSLPLKQLAISTLLFSFSQYTSFVSAFFRIRALISGLRDRLPALQSLHSEERRSEAVSFCLRALTQLQNLCTVTMKRDRSLVKELQDQIANLGGHEPALAILHMPLQTRPPEEEGHLAEATDRRQLRLMRETYFFIARFCEENRRNQKLVAPHLPLFRSHVEVRGTGVEVAMEAVAKDNREVLRQVGMQWIAMLLGEVIPRYRCRRARWLRVVEACVECDGKALKENQGLVMKLLRANQEMISSLFKGEQWDERISLMRTVGEICYAVPRNESVEVKAVSKASPDVQIVDTGNGAEAIHGHYSESGRHGGKEEGGGEVESEPKEMADGGCAMNWEEDVSKMDCPLEYHVGFVRLLEVCSHGKNPASEVHSSSFFSLKDVVEAIAGLDVRQDGGREQGLKWSVTSRVRGAFCGLLLHVYIDTDVDRLLAEVRDNTGLFWKLAGEESRRTYPPVMQLLRDEVVQFVDWWVDKMRAGAVRQDSAEAWGMYDVARSMIGSVFPMLTGYYRRFAGRLDPSLEHKEISEDIFDAALRLMQAQLVPEAVKIYLESGQVVCVKLQAAELCRIISLKAHVRSEWVFSDGAQKGMTLEDMPECFMYKMKLRQLKVTLRRGFMELGKALGKCNGVTDTQRLIGLGHRQLAVMLSREGKLVGFYADKRIRGRDSLDMGRDDPYYHSLVMSIVEACQEDSGTKTTVLVDILRALRAAVYMYRPGKEEGDLSEYDEQWERFLDDQPVLKAERDGSGKGVQDEMLRYVQNKFDAMGCTSAALRLVSHPDITVQVNAARLLLALLQGCNRRVQQSIARLLDEEEGVRFFEAMRGVFDASIDTLKDFKRTLKGLKGGTAGSSSAKESASSRSFLGHGHTRRDDSHQSLRGLGRQSHLMISLRLLQLCCEGQYKPLQDVMSGQAGRQVSVDLLNRMVALFEAAQPLVTDALWFNDGDLVVLCMMIVDVLSETVQGPNTANQVALLQSNFLAVVNRLLSALMYSNLPDDRKRANGFDVSVNDLKCWLKTSILNCCLAMVEGVKDSEQPAQMLQFFEIKNFIQQMVTNARLLGILQLEEPQEQLTHLGPVEADWGGACMEEAQALQPEAPPPTTTSQKSQKRFARAFSLRSSGTRGRAPSMHIPSSKRDQNPAAPMHFAEGYEDALEDEMFLFFFLLLSLADYDRHRAIGQHFETLEIDHRPLWEYLSTHSSQVELVRKDMVTGQALVERVHFRVTPEVLRLTSGRDFVERAKESLFNVPRDNPQEKAREFLSKLKEVRDQAGWLQYVSQKESKKFYIRYRDNFELVPLLLSVLITVLLLLFYGIPVDPNTDDIVGSGRYYTSRDKPPWGYSDKPYPFANSTSDPAGIGASYANIYEQLDLSLDFRLALRSRWQSEDEWRAFPAMRWTICVLAIIHAAFTCLNACGYLLFDFPLVLKQAFEHHFALSDASKQTKTKGRESGKDKASRIVALKRGDSSNLRVRDELQPTDFLRNLPPVPREREVEYTFALWWSVFRHSGQFAHWAFLTMISILGVAQSPFYYVAFMLDFFRRKDGRLVLDAIIVGGPNILRSFTLGMVGLVCFGFYTYAYFSSTVIWEHDACHTPFQCVVVHVLESMTGDLTSVLGNDFGAFAFPALVVWEDSWQAWRSFVVFVSVIFWVFLLQGIIQGQIIDTFAAMRNAAEAAREDLEQKCFVSSIDRFVFNNYPGEWEKRRGGQYAWNYLLFFIHLLDKDPEEYNGLENAVADSYKHNRIDFLPIEMFYARQREQLASIKAEAKAEMTNISSRVESMEGSLAELRQQSNRMVAMMRWKSAINSMASAAAKHGDAR